MIKPTPHPKRQQYCLLGLGIPKRTFEQTATTADADVVPKFPYFIVPMGTYETMDAAKAARNRQAEVDGRLELAIVPVGRAVPLSQRDAEETDYLNTEEDKYMKQFQASQKSQRDFIEKKADESRRKAIVKDIVPADQARITHENAVTIEPCRDDTTDINRTVAPIQQNSSSSNVVNPWEEAEQFFPLSGITIEDGVVRVDTISMPPQ